MPYFSLHNSTLSMLTVFMQSVSFLDCKVTIEMPIAWSKELSISTRWLVDTIWWSLLDNLFWRNLLFTIIYQQVFSCRYLNLWIYLEKKVALEQRFSIIRFFWKSIWMILLLVYYALILIRFRVSLTSFLLTSYITLVIILVLGIIVFI